MTDGELAKVRGWMSVLSQAVLKVRPGSEKYVLYTGMVMTLGAVLHLLNQSGENGVKTHPYYYGFEEIVKDIQGFGVRVVEEPR